MFSKGLFNAVTRVLSILIFAAIEDRRAVEGKNEVEIPETLSPF